MQALIVNGLTKRFGERIAFSDVSFAVESGEVFGFLGPNGAGKTTMVRTLGALLDPSVGSAIVAGLPLGEGNADEIRKRIAIMPEAPGLYLRLSVAENLECFAGLYELTDVRARIERALHAVGLFARADDLCGALSKGLRQRVSLARTLLSDPDVLFLDEPTSGLDPVAAHEVHDLIDGLRQRGVTIFLTTHRLAEAEQLCDRVAILNTTLRAVGRPDELREQLFASTLTVCTGAPLLVPDDVFGGLPGVDSWRSDETNEAEPNKAETDKAETDKAETDKAETNKYVLVVTSPGVAAPAVTRALVAAGADVMSIGESHHSLEDVYLQLIDEDVEASIK